MLIPVIISLLVSTIFLNLELPFSSRFLASGKTNSAKTGLVLGVSEYQAAGKIIIEEGNSFNQAIIKVIEQAKALPLPQLPQFNLNAPMRKLPPNPKKPAAAETVSFDLAAENGVILDSQSHNLFFSKRPDRAWPIASITKLFTAYTFLDYNPGWETNYEIKPSDKREGGKIYLFTGDKVKVKDLFYFSLVGSDNTATAALVSSTGLTEAEFVVKINNKIKDLGLKNTRLVDATGLVNGNISTAREIAQFANLALETEEIKRAALTKEYEFTTEQGRIKAIASTNELLNIFPEQGISLLGGKTGYINSSGYCLVSKFKGQDGRAIITVVLGADSEASRFDLTKKLAELYYNNKP
ncbi:MAG: D-alanyl-D-alanine carboxypeptidase [Parcubacteria group bacterium]|nr:D-alanyl-D-alanine carboxypeptidase [Parcubacteria group bacterium]